MGAVARRLAAEPGVQAEIRPDFEPADNNDCGGVVARLSRAEHAQIEHGEDEIDGAIKQVESHRRKAVFRHSAHWRGGLLAVESAPRPHGDEKQQGQDGKRRGHSAEAKGGRAILETYLLPAGIQPHGAEVSVGAQHRLPLFRYRLGAYKSLPARGI